MSVPPPPPGQPGGWAPQPGNNPSPNYGQQPGGYPQQPGMGQQPPYGQPGGFPQTGGFGQQPGYGIDPNFPGQPPRKKSPLPWILTGVGVVVVLVVVLVGGFVWPGFFTGGATGSPEKVTQALVTAFNTKNLNSINNDICADQRGSSAGSLQSQENELNSGEMAKVQFNVSEVGTPQVNGNTATSTIKLSGSVEGQTVNTTAKVTLKQENGGWCLEDFNADDASSGSGSTDQNGSGMSGSSGSGGMNSDSGSSGDMDNNGGMNGGSGG